MGKKGDHPNRLREIRKALTDKDQGDVADEMGVNRKTFNSWETGAADLSGTHVRELCDYYGCTPNDIFGYGHADRPLASLTPEEMEFVMHLRGMSPTSRRVLLSFARENDLRYGGGQHRR